MKNVTTSDLTALADQLERTAKRIRLSGPEAVRRAQDWSGAALRSSGTDPGRGKGQTSNPTLNAAMQEMDHPDPNAEQLLLLTSEAGRCFDAVVTLESRISRIAVDKLTVNERAGIGWCASPTCERYCDGTASNRLRNLICPSCDQKERRDKDKPELCTHQAKRRWSHGVETCMGCGVELTEAGRAVG